DLIGRGYTETRYSEDGTRVTTSPSEDHCYYHGHVEGDTDSSVSVGICSGISGFVRARQQLYLIEPLGRSDEGDHAVYRHEHLKTSSSNTTVLFDRERDRDQGPGPGPGYKQYGSDTKSRILGVINHVDKLYRPLNIRVLLVGLEIWTHRDFIDVDINSETTLDNFLLWRQADLQRMTKHDNAQFVTGKDFDGDTVGLANKFAMCGENSGGVNQDHHHNLIGLAATIAHEMGHNLGLSHDAAGCVCGPSRSSGNCVMAEKLSEAFPEFFSSCSVQQLAEFMERAQPSCLDKPRGVRTIAVGPRCGNALLDPGEECDCGTVEECKNLCCDASTCRLTEGSQCAHGQCCDNCQFQSAGSVCRKSAGDCDLPEYCTGESEDCPDDGFEMNGKPCYDQSQGFCHDGQCPTHEQHCWRLFGLGTVNTHPPPPVMNLKCGSIFCQGGGESITGKRAAYTVRGNTECKLVVDDYNTRNFDMVPKGTRCGPNKVCLDHRCMDVSVYGKREDCAKKCSDKGVCNHKNECHCHPGWAPPYCDIQYADIPQGTDRGIITGVCAALAVLLLVTAVIAGLMCCKKDNMDNYTSKRKVHSAPDKLNPMYQEASVKERPQISSPTLMESTATQACAPLTVAMAPSRTAPQVQMAACRNGYNVPFVCSLTSSSSSPPQTKPQPPAKPLPPLNKPQVSHAFDPLLSLVSL
uniref:Disintegrin and metalloproteinase domain-containing protein 8 n=1 Tax=Scophthalmus maximus TaxID=52904 RepID=A0A8D3ADI5_SCOMX